jgi:hypothetical protein
VERTASLAAAADARHPELPDRLAALERALERAQLAIGSCGLRELRASQVGSLATEAVKLEHEPSQITELDLTQRP